MHRHFRLHLCLLNCLRHLRVLHGLLGLHSGAFHFVLLAYHLTITLDHRLNAGRVYRRAVLGFNLCGLNHQIGIEFVALTVVLAQHLFALQLKFCCLLLNVSTDCFHLNLR